MNVIEFGDCRETMRKWAAEGVKAQMCVTSPPYFGLRDYGHEGQIGLEQTPEEYIQAMVEVFRCVWDVLANDGTLWLNIGDSYNAYKANTGGTKFAGFRNQPEHRQKGYGLEVKSLKNKDLIGIPWMLAFALRTDGWYLRQDIIWHKPNPMPESVRDRCTKAHEYIFLLSKSERYFFDGESLKEPAINAGKVGGSFKGRQGSADYHAQSGGLGSEAKNYETRNRRSVWTVATRPYKGAHFATFPPDLIEPCILAGSRPDDIVLDPFMGSGTTAAVAISHGRQYLGCELNPAYKELQDERILAATPVPDPQIDLFADEQQVDGG